MIYTVKSFSTCEYYSPYIPYGYKQKRNVYDK